MPEFGHPFSGLASDRKLTHEELVRAIRFMIAAEYEAVQTTNWLRRFSRTSPTKSGCTPESSSVS
jgi:hypothetical protein